MLTGYLVRDEHIEAETKWPPFWQTTFSIAFSWLKMIEFWISLNRVSRSPNDNVSIGADNGLAPIRRQVITWTNDDPVHWRIYASLGVNELNGSSTENITLRNGLVFIIQNNLCFTLVLLSQGLQDLKNFFKIYSLYYNDVIRYILLIDDDFFQTGDNILYCNLHIYTDYLITPCDK